MHGKLNILKIGSGIVHFLFISFTCLSQQYHDLGGKEIVISEIFSSNTSTPEHNLFTRSFLPPLSDTAMSYHQLTFSSNLTIDTVKTLSHKKIPDFLALGFTHSRFSLQRAFLTYNNLDKPGGHFFFSLAKLHYCELGNDSVRNCISLLPDSAYLYAQNNWFHYTLPNNDTVYSIIEYTLGKNDSLVKQYLIKLDTLSGQVVRRELDLRYQGEEIIFGSAPLLLSDGKLFFTGVQFNRIAQSFFTITFTIDKSLHSIHNVRKRLSGIPSGKWQKGNKVFLFCRAERYDPTVLTQIVYESVIEVIDLAKDTMTTRYYFPSNPKSIFPDGYERAGPGSYFNGEYFVLSETVNQDTSGSRNYETNIFAVDTNFNIISSKTITNSNKLYYGRITSIIPHPDSADTYIYCGDADNFPLTNEEDVMLGKFRVKSGIGVKELKLRKAQVYLYPNPASEFVDVIIDSPEQENYELQFYNTAGEMVIKTRVQDYRSRIPLELKAGVYTVVASSEKNTEVLSLVVQ